MTDRYQLAALSASIPLFVAALAPIALLAPEASARLDALTASVAATQDEVDKVTAIIVGIRDLGSVGAGAVADWLAVTADMALIPAPTLSPALMRAQDLAKAASRLVVAACFQEAAVSAISAPPAFRDDVDAIRLKLVTGLEPILDGLAAMGSLEAHAAVATTVDLAIAGLDDLALTVAPLAVIRSTRSLPAPILAWQLYGDVERCDEVVARAASLTPLFMPKELLLPAPTAI